MLMQHAGCFENNVYIPLPSFQLLPHCLCRQHRNVKLLLAEKKTHNFPGISTSEFFFSILNMSILKHVEVVHVWWNLAPCCEEGFRLYV